MLGEGIADGMHPLGALKELVTRSAAKLYTDRAQGPMGTYCATGLHQLDLAVRDGSARCTRSITAPWPLTAHHQTHWHVK